jgi:RNA polymerase sigma-70 factor (ECF subfamily)
MVGRRSEVWPSPACAGELLTPRRSAVESDRELAFANDQERAFASFVASHRERALGMAWRLLGGDAAAAEDVAQEAFARAHRALGSFRGEAALSTWFHRILVNEAQRYRRWRWVRDRFGGPMPADPVDPGAAPPGDPALRRRVALALDALPRGQREAFVLVHLEGMTMREAAETTGRAVGTIKSHLHRALRNLRTQLADLDPRGETT